MANNAILSPAMSSQSTSTIPSPALTAFDSYPSDSSASSVFAMQSPDLRPMTKTDRDTQIQSHRSFLGPPAMEESLLSPTPGRQQTVAGEKHLRGGARRADGTVECWGHRGASADFPENTIASFEATFRQGADGLETDLHMTADHRLICFHDPVLDRTTDGKGKIHEQNWEGNLENVRTLEEPHQPIPLFSQVLELIMKPENQHVTLNLDCKVENDPRRLYSMIRDNMALFENWEKLIAPRVVLGIWHPKFLEPAKEILPFLPRYAISMSLSQVRQHFWPRCDGFSVWFPTLLTAEGRRFRMDCQKEGKTITVWTVNDESEMKECIRWGVRAIITDKPKVVVALREECKAKPEVLLQSLLQRLTLPWSKTEYFSFKTNAEAHTETVYLEREGGKFSSYP